MNKEDFVTYEQALALKKLGFSYDCDYLYLDTSELAKYDYHNEFYDGQFYENCISAPTLAQAQKWLRKMNIDIEISMIPHPNHIRTYNVYAVCTNKHKPFGIDGEGYNSYEEALSAGITECLKLLNK